MPEEISADLPTFELEQFREGIAFLTEAVKSSTYPGTLETIVAGSAVIGYVGQQVLEYFEVDKPNVFGGASCADIHEMSRLLAELGREIDATAFDADLRQSMRSVGVTAGGPIIDWVIAAALDRLLVWLEEAGLDFIGDAIAEILDLLDG